MRRSVLLFLIAGFLAGSIAGCVGSCSKGKKDEPIALASPSPATDAGPEIRARLTSVTGDVKLKRAKRPDYVAATKGAGLSIGDVISTGGSGNATITFLDGSTASITPRSLVTIEPPANSAADGIGVQRGRVDVEITSAGQDGFRVRTPDAEANAVDPTKVNR